MIWYGLAGFGIGVAVASMGYTVWFYYLFKDTWR